MAMRSLLLKLLGFICLAALIWFAGPLVSFAGYAPLGSRSSRLFLIAALIVFAIVKRIASWWRSREANKKLSANIASDATETNSASDADLATLSHDLNQALSTLKSEAKVGLYELPWYIIIGAPGTGKTTALANSGLRFPLAERNGKTAFQGVGGTRHCDWWFSDEAIFLDTAGRYTTQDSDKDTDNTAWLGFLRMLRSSRGRRPINGVLVTVSTSNLLENSPTEKEQLIHSIRQRLQELQSELGVNPPVYLLITKTDLLQGFEEFFEDLGQRGREQVLGFTFQEEPQSKPIDTLKHRCDELVSNLNRRVLWRMRGERDRLRNKDIFSFPQQLATVGNALTEFCESLFVESRYEVSPRVRGVYFTSGTQEGTPIDRLVGSYSRGLAGQTTGNTTGGQARSYFLQNVLKDIVLPEKELVGTNAKVEARKRWIHRGVIASAAASVLLGILLWSTSYIRNQVLVNEFEQSVDSYRAALSGPLAEPQNTQQLLDRLDAAAEPVLMLQPINEATPMLIGLGLYQGQSLSDSASRVYHAELEQYLLPTINYLLQDFLSGAGNEPQLTYEALKAYLMLSEPERRDPDLIEAWTFYEWQRLYPSDVKTQGRSQRHVVALNQFDYRSTDKNDAVVSTARAELAQYSLATLLYGRIKQDFSYTANPTIDLLASAGPYSADIFSVENAELATLSRLFTKEGYKTEFKPLLEQLRSMAEAEYWVLSDLQTDLNDAELDALRDEIRDLYFSDYNQTWDTTLSRIEIAQFGGMAGAAKRLKILAGDNSPLHLLTEKVVDETSLARGISAGGLSTTSLATEAADRIGRILGSQQQGAIEETLLGPEVVVDKHFSGVSDFVRKSESGSVPSQDAKDLISDMYQDFDLLSSGLLADKEDKLTSLFDSERILKLQLQAKDSVLPISRWLNQVAINSRQAVFQELQEDINEDWRGNVLPFCQRAASGRYPFVEESTRDISLRDFGSLLGPSGLISKFQRERLAKFISTEGASWSWRNFPGLSTTFSRTSLSQLQRAQRIENAFFSNGGELPEVNFTLTPLYLDANVRKVQIEAGSDTFRYRHGPARSYQAVWPDDTANGLTRFEYEDDSGQLIAKTFRGPWSFFHFLDLTERSSPTNTDKVRFTLDFKGRRSTWQLDGPGVENPFADDLLTGFRCPQGF